MPTKFSLGQRVSLYGSSRDGTPEGRTKGTVQKIVDEDDWVWDKYEVLWDNGTVSKVPTSYLDPVAP